jgi:hypothetical protein
MRTFRSSCINFFKDDIVKQDIQEMVKPIYKLFYNEIYIYIWIIAFYHIFIIFMITSMFYILIRMMKAQDFKDKMFLQIVQ